MIILLITGYDKDEQMEDGVAQTWFVLNMYHLKLKLCSVTSLKQLPFSTHFPCMCHFLQARGQTEDTMARKPAFQH